MKLVSAAFIVTVHKNDLGPDLVLFPGLEMLNPSKPDNVFLEAAPGFSSNALFLCANGNPTICAHPVENGGSRKKTISFRNAFDWLGSENTRSKTAHFIIRNCYRSRDSDLVELLFSAVLMLVDLVSWLCEPQQRGEALGATGVFLTFGFGRKSMLGIFFEPKAKR